MMDRTYLRLFTNNGKPVEAQPGMPEVAVARSPATSSNFDAAVADVTAVHNAVKRLQKAILEGDAVSIRALARSAEYKAERAASAAAVLRDLCKRAAS